MSLVRAAHIILASASPRRSSIMNEQLGLNVRAIASGFAEDLDKGSLKPVFYVQETARQKALEVFGRCEKPFKAQHNRPPSLVIGADTVVVLDGEIMEKPSSMEDARRMLRALSDAGTHSVITGVCMLYGGTELGAEPYEKTFAEITTVSFKKLSDEEINAYVSSGEPMDKAGAYGIQGLGGCFVEGITGDYFNVVGFPVSRFSSEIEVSRLQEWVAAAPKEELPEAPEEEPCDPLAPIISDECMDDEECGLPSD